MLSRLLRGVFGAASAAIKKQVSRNRKYTPTYYEGQQAYRDGSSPTAHFCHYKEGTEAHKDWHLGFAGKEGLKGPLAELRKTSARHELM